MCRFTRVCCVVLFVAAVLCSVAAADEIRPLRQKLSPYNIDIRQSSVSGLSAGGFMANQFFVAYSGIMSGVGVFAGGPYGCARGNIWKALNDCMARPSFLTTEVMTQLTDKAGSYSREGRIDPVENLKLKKIFLFSGMADKT
ncbi:MAG: PHB depolymerase family esterase, partial [Smithella sp.]